MTRSALAGRAAVLCVLIGGAASRAEELPGTKPLTIQGDLAAQMVAGIDKYLMREIDAAAAGGADKWNVDTSSFEKYLASVKPNRDRLAKLLGVVDPRVSPVVMEYVGEGRPTALVAETKAYKVYAVRWPTLPGVDGEGLLLEPEGGAKASVVAIPDADQTPEQLVGLAPGIAAESQFARRLAESGCRVIVPVLIDRKPTSYANGHLTRDTNIPHREFIWRMAYEMGRHIIGYEVQKVLAAVDWLKSQPECGLVGLFGYCEGGLIALYSGCLDERVTVTIASGLDFNSRLNVWQEPIDRSVWAMLPEFGDSHLRKFFRSPRSMYNELSMLPNFEIANPPGYRKQAAAGRIALHPNSADILKEPGRRDATRTLTGTFGSYLVPHDGLFGSPRSVLQMASHLGIHSENVPLAPNALGNAPKEQRKSFDPGARQMRQFNQLIAFTQRLWRLSDNTRRSFFTKADVKSPEAWEKSSEAYRDYFWTEVIGKLPKQTLEPNPRTRLIHDTPKWKGYDVVLDLYPDVFAYGQLLLPKDLKPGEKRPVVVCQHGLEGRPSDVTDPTKKTPYYNSFGAQLADMGYIVYAPQNPYIGWEKFRVLQRKAHPLKLSLFAFIVRQHEATLDWLSSLPNVDGDRIGFYGLSYGGKTAMRVPAILKKYALSICSADFNEWVGKNVSVDFNGSYLYTIEYDMYEFDLGSTFNYAEMAYLIAPRPFMVERGHDDGVGIDEMIAHEYAKIRYFYANRLKLADRTAIEFFAGGHEIRLKGTAEFLKKHLGWPK